MFLARVGVAVFSVVCAGGIWVGLVYLLSLTQIMVLNGLAFYLSNDTIFGYLFFGLLVIVVNDAIVWKLFRHQPHSDSDMASR